VSNVNIDGAVARAVFHARLMERVLHDPGPWELSWGPHRVPARKLVDVTGVSLLGLFPATCYLSRPEPALGLWLRRELVDMRPLADPGDEEFVAAWGYEVATVTA